MTVKLLINIQTELPSNNFKSNTCRVHSLCKNRDTRIISAGIQPTFKVGVRYKEQEFVVHFERTV